MQFDQGFKGFSFSKEGPLDMRMDPTSGLTAAEVVNTWSEKELGNIFREYGEEKNWRRAAQTVVEARKKKKIETTTELADIIVNAFKGKRGKLHPATLIFQGLRICVNKELDAIQEALGKAINLLASGGRMGVLSFHRLEDRIVKNVFKAASAVSAKQKRSGAGPLAALRLLTKKPLSPTVAEIRANPRARSAKLRFAEKT